MISPSFEMDAVMLAAWLSSWKHCICPAEMPQWQWSIKAASTVSRLSDETLLPRFGPNSMLGSFSLSHRVIYLLKSTTTSVFEFVWNLKLDKGTKLLVTPFFQWEYCRALYVYRCWEKCHVLFGIHFEQWGRFHKLYSVVSYLGETTLWSSYIWKRLHIVVDGWSISPPEGDFWLIRTGSNSMIKKVFLCACLWTCGRLCLQKLFSVWQALFLVVEQAASVSLTQMGDKDPFCWEADFFTFHVGKYGIQFHNQVSNLKKEIMDISVIGWYTCEGSMSNAVWREIKSRSRWGVPLDSSLPSLYLVLV